MISKETIATIRETARVEEVVGDFVILKRRGVNMLGLCPFHDEKTPSFTVSPTKGIYKCFGCGQSGDSVKFIMEHEHFTYPEALRYLAKKYNIDIEETEETPEQKAEETYKESLFAVNQFAENYFMGNLWNSDKGKAIGISYFKERGFSEEIIKKFRLGYSFEEWDHLLKTAAEQGYKTEYLKTVGLLTSGEKTVDMYRGRVMFPIHNLSGRVLGFGGRILRSNEKAPKYINSPESEIYNKSRILYGLYFAKNAIVRNDTCYLVEGYTDVISMHQAGIENVVASSGTSLTTGQVQLVRRYTQNITILYDGDSAGIKASFRGIDMILEEGMNVKVVLFPDGEDPDSFSKKHSGEELKEFLRTHEKDFIRFKADILMKDAGDDPIRKAGVIKDMVSSIALIPDGIARTLFIQQCSDLMRVNEEILYSELNKVRREKLKQKGKKEDEPVMDQPYREEKTPLRQTEIRHPGYPGETQELEILRVLLNYGGIEFPYKYEDENGEMVEEPVKVGDFIVHDLQADEIEMLHPVHQLIFKDLCGLVLNGQHDQIQQHFINHTDDEVRNLAMGLITQQYHLSEGWESKYRIFTEREDMVLQRTVMHVLYRFKATKLEHMIESLKKKLADTTQPEEITSILTTVRNLEAVKKKLSDELTVVIWK